MLEADAAPLERRSYGGPRPVRLSTGSSAGEFLAVAVRAATSGFALLRDRLSSDAYIDPSRLRTVRSLGEGAFGHTHRAELRPASGGDGGKDGGARDVAVKTLRRELLDDPEQVAMFVKEVELLRKLRHRHIVEFIGCSWQRSSCSLDDGSTRGGAGVKAIYFVQEFCAGGSLGDLVRRQMIRPYKRLYSDADALRWCLQMAHALQYLHELRTPVMHRDLKLDNMMLSSADVTRVDAKLGDFGLARLTLVEEMRKLEEERASHKMLSKQGSTLTDPGSGDSAFSAAVSGASSDAPLPAVLGGSDVLAALDQGGAVYGTSHRFAAAVEPTGRTGSYGYMAPEVLRSQQYNARCDIFSLGMCMHNIFARTIPSFHILLTGGEEHLEQYAQLVADGYRPPLPADLPRALCDLISACWKGEPTLRPDAAAVVAALEAIQDSGELGHSRPSQASSSGCCTVM